MNDQDLRTLLDQVKELVVSPDTALEQLKSGPFRKTDLGYAQLDHHRGVRNGLGEVVYGEGKSIEQILGIAAKFAESPQPTLITRLDDAKREALRDAFPGGRENAEARTFMIHPPKEKGIESGEAYVAVVAAGTSDLYVAEEAAEVCVAMGVAFGRYYDIGVTGLHRLLAKLEPLQKATAVVVAAGMEGALPSVVAGLVGRPVFAVPTSVGYGASFGGVTALLAMLNSCAPGVTVVNIDNGFSAAFAAANVVRAVNEAKRERTR